MTRETLLQRRAQEYAQEVYGSVYVQAIAEGLPDKIANKLALNFLKILNKRIEHLIKEKEE